ncbi:MAG: hypothetical protein H7Z72_04355 [Bacteroidetes bacterium]|nr:hypothetical protein [Fibrella sp.]
MKKTLTYTLTFGLLALLSCRDDSLNPVPVFDPGVHALGVFADVPEGKAGGSDKKNFTNYEKNFPLTGQEAAAAAVKFNIRWVTLDNKLTVNKIEIYVDMLESYTDPDGNPRTVSLGSGGKLIKTIDPSMGNRQWNSFSIAPVDIYNLYKDATVKYDRVNAVNVFTNPATARPTGRWFNRTDNFVMVWRLYTTDGQVFKTWNSDSVCGDPTPVSQANSNCSLTWSAR